MVSEQENKQIVRRYWEAYNTGDSGVFREIIGRDLTLHSQGNTTPVCSGPDFFARDLETYRTAIPDVHVVIEDLLADGEKVVVRLSTSGTHLGELSTPWGTFAPTGKRLTWTEIDVHRLAGGKIVEQWFEIDWASLLVQLGVVPAPAGS